LGMTAISAFPPFIGTNLNGRNASRTDIETEAPPAGRPRH
jgi:hypothetical protein